MKRQQQAKTLASPGGDAARERQELRDLTRQAHEAAQELDRLLKLAAVAGNDLEARVRQAVLGTFGEEVSETLKRFAAVAERATKDSTDAIFARFDKLQKAIFVSSKNGPLDDGPATLEELVRIRNRANQLIEALNREAPDEFFFRGRDV